MKLSALLFLAVCTCVAQTTTAFPSRQNQASQTPGIVDDQAVALAASAVAVSAAEKNAQSMMEHISQENCPVVLTSAWLSPRLQLLTSGDASGGNGIDLQFRNASGKEIRSIELSATILVKKSIYDLGYLPPVHLYLTAYGTRTIDSAFAQLRHLSLPGGIHAALVEGVTLEQVSYEDGSVWTPANSDHCGIGPDQTLPVAR